MKTNALVETYFLIPHKNGGPQAAILMYAFRSVAQAALRRLAI